MGEMSDVLKIERAIKQCSKQEKLLLIQSHTELKRLLRKKGITTALIKLQLSQG